LHKTTIFCITNFSFLGEQLLFFGVPRFFSNFLFSG